jgi:hypothetical protein
MRNLTKFCCSEHNIDSGAKLLIGTLQKYRDSEDDELNDASEGTYQYKLSFPEPIELDIRMANLLFSSGIAFGDTSNTPRFAGGFEVKIDEVNIDKVTDAALFLKRAEVTVKREVPNSHILCMSQASEEFKNPFPKLYDSSWSVPFTQATDLANKLGGLIFNQISMDAYQLAGLNSLRPSDFRNLSLNIRHMPVRYKSRNYIITPDNMPSYEELLKDFNDVSFIKPLSYRVEQEYRFEFQLVCGDRILAARKKDQLLNLNTLRA